MENLRKPTKPNISEETMRKMVEFFQKTSIPRILAERQKENALKGDMNIESTIQGNNEKTTSSYKKNIITQSFGKSKRRGKGKTQ